MLEPGHWQVGTGRTDLLVRRLGRKIFMVIENDQRTKVGVSYTELPRQAAGKALKVWIILAQYLPQKEP